MTPSKRRAARASAPDSHAAAATGSAAATGPAAAARTDGTLPPGSIGATLRQMIAALEAERQALASLDADGLFEAARVKETLCDALGPFDRSALSAETRPLAETAQHLNEVNRRVRNLLAANVAARLEALGAPRVAYRAGRHAPFARNIGPL